MSNGSLEMRWQKSSTDSPRLLRWFDHNSSQQAENFKKILLTLTDDPRVILIKLADRLHNMRTLESMKREKQLKVASETIYVYAPLAHRMGLYNIKTEMEDLAMKYMEPDQYKEVSQKLAETKRERTRYINEFIKPVREKLDGIGFQYEIYGRPKSIHSIWNKMKKKNVAFEEVYDLFCHQGYYRCGPGKRKGKLLESLFHHYRHVQSITRTDEGLVEQSEIKWLRSLAYDCDGSAGKMGGNTNPIQTHE